MPNTLFLPPKRHNPYYLIRFSHSQAQVKKFLRYHRACVGARLGGLAFAFVVQWVRGLRSSRQHELNYDQRSGEEASWL